MANQSMTGFGKGEIKGDNYTLTVEIKSVNHRFKDFRFKMSSIFNSKEMELKKYLEKSCVRGSFDVFVNYKKDQEKVEEVEVDTEKVSAFLKKMQKTADQLDLEMSFRPTEFLRQDFVKENTDKEEELLSLIVPAFEKAVDGLVKSRLDEGEKLIQKLAHHQSTYTNYFEEVTTFKDSYQNDVREKLMKRFEKVAPELNIDEPRFLQEIIYYLEKLDIEEEITRVQIHLKKLSGILGSSGEVGRQIEFLLQELNRETNTIGSKSNNQQISENIVQMKVQLEKIREQALNLQ